MWSFIFLGLWVLVVGVVLLALWLNWVAWAGVRAGLIGASFGLVGASLWQSPTVLDALFALGLFTGLALITVGDGHLAALPDLEPHSTPEWTDEAIGALSGTRGRFDELAIRFGVLCCASALLVAVLQVAALPPRAVAAVPDAPRPTATATPYRRLPQAATPSVTPTATATPMPTPSPTVTPTPGPALLSNWTDPHAIWVPPGPTPLPRVLLDSPLPAQDVSAFRFTLEAPQYLSNHTNQNGCQWSGVGGEVFDTAGNPLTGYVVRLWFADQPRNAVSGDAPAYGPAGFEFALGDHPRATTGFYVIELLDSAGRSVSPRYGLDTYGDCDRNFVLVVFVEE